MTITTENTWLRFVNLFPPRNAALRWSEDRTLVHRVEGVATRSNDDEIIVTSLLVCDTLFLFFPFFFFFKIFFKINDFPDKLNIIIVSSCNYFKQKSSLSIRNKIAPRIAIMNHIRSLFQCSRLVLRVYMCMYIYISVSPPINAEQKRSN